MYLLEWDLYLVAPEGLELRDPAGLDFRGVPVPGLAPGVVGTRGTRSSRASPRCRVRAGAPGRSRGNGGGNRRGRRRGCCVGRCTRSQAPAGWPRPCPRPAARAGAGSARGLPAGRRGPRAALRTSSHRSCACTRRRRCPRPARSAAGIARSRLPYRRGRARADAPRSARAVGTEGSSSPTAMVFSSWPCGNSRSARGCRGPFSCREAFGRHTPTFTRIRWSVGSPSSSTRP